MKKGAVGLFDALGFKGIWKEHPTDRVIATLRQISRAANKCGQALAELLNERTEKVRLAIDVAAFSDTLVLTSTAEPRSAAISETTLRTRSIRGLMAAASAVSTIGVLGNPPIIYRGAISYGEFELGDGKFFVGPAIDEAARLESEAEAAIIYLCPTALRAFDTGEPPAFGLRYPVPLKGGRTFNTCAANPFQLTKLGERFRAFLDLVDAEISIPSGLQPDDFVLKKYLEAFSSDELDVVVKRQHTEAFLLQARRELRPAAALTVLP